MQLKDFLLNSEQPIVADGGMATSLYDKGFYFNRSFEELSVTASEAVREVHIGFKKAGAKLLGTNTFGASIPRLNEYNIQDRLAEILQASVKLAREAAEDQSYVLGVIGPVGLVLEPLGPTSFEEAQSLFGQNASILDEAQVDGFSLEGFHDLKELRAAILAVRGHSQKPIIASIGIQENKRTSFGHSIEEFVRLANQLSVEVVGLTGDIGPSGMLTALEQLRPLTKKPILLKPTAGLPRYVNGQYIYLCNPDYMGKFAKRFVQAGANLVGGYSGVQEEHLRAIANALRMTSSTQSSSARAYDRVIPQIVDQPKEKVPLNLRSKLGEHLLNKKQIFSVEINSPRGIDFERFKEQCAELEVAGLEFVNIPDGARASARMSSTHLASFVSRNFSLEPIPHFTTRDRNLLGIQSDLLGAHANGVRNILSVTGDPPKLGNCPGATGVYDVDAIGLTHILDRMNQGLDLGGSSFGNPTSFTIGVALNPTASNQDLERRRFRYKVEAGCDFAITQPIYDLDAYESFFEGLADVDVPIIMGIWPLVSLRNAEFLRNEVPGVVVPDWALAEMEKAGDDKEEALSRGLDIAIRTMQRAIEKKMVVGFQVSAPFNRVQVALKAIQSV